MALVEANIGIRGQLTPALSGSSARQPDGEPLTFFKPAAIDKLLPDWRGLADNAIASNPFMAPEFILPAATHLAGSEGVTFAAAWRAHKRSRELIGLFALTTLRSGGRLRWLRPRATGLWSCPALPVAPMLLHRDPTAARLALEALVGETRRSHGGRLVLSGLEPDGPAACAVLAAAAAFGRVPQREADLRHTRGLDVMLSREPTVEAIAVATEPAELRAMLEQALAMDAGVARLPGEALPAVFDASELAFLRAMVRGLSQTGQVVMARLRDRGQSAAALALKGADRVWLWRMFGPAAQDPKAEAVLTLAIRSAVGLPVIAATTRPLAGFCAASLRTETWTFGF